ASDGDVVLQVLVGEEAPAPERGCSFDELRMFETELSKRLRQEIRQALGARSGKHLGGIVSFASELGGKLLEDDRRARAIIHERAVEIEHDDRHRLTGDRSAARHDSIEQRILLVGWDAAICEMTDVLVTRQATLLSTLVEVAKGAPSGVGAFTMTYGRCPTCTKRDARWRSATITRLLASTGRLRPRTSRRRFASSPRSTTLTAIPMIRKRPGASRRSTPRIRC